MGLISRIQFKLENKIFANAQDFCDMVICQKQKSESSEAWGKFASTTINKVSLNSYAHQECTTRKLTLQVKQSKAYKKVSAFHCNSKIFKTSVLSWYGDMSKDIM